jgi:hypothetical protein
VVKGLITEGTLGAFVTPATRNKVRHGWKWGLDNGAYAGFDEDAYLSALEAYRPFMAGCLFVAVPDVLYDWEATLASWRDWCDYLHAWPRAIVLQDGATIESIPWDEAHTLFIGGSTEWKLSPDARALITEGVRRGMPVHMGRVNSFSRLKYADSLGCATADGTYLGFGPDTNLPKLLRWLDRNQANPEFNLWT